MIIQCDQCEAKFKLDESKVPEQGRKVRCAKCQHIFLVQKPKPEPEEELDVRIDEEELAKMEEQEPPPEPDREPVEAFEPTVKIDLSAQEELEFTEVEEPALPSPPPRKRGLGKSIGMGLAVLAVLVVAAFILDRMEILRLLPRPAEEPSKNLMVDKDRLEGAWENNAQVPRIFVVKGTVKNQSKKPRAYIRVKAFLYDKTGKTLKEGLAYCGNPIPARDLRTKGKDEIMKFMENRNGQEGSNKRIAPGKSISFSVVFFDVPKGVESFGAQIEDAVIPGSS